MGSLLTAPVHLAQPHALPFRTIFEEHLRRQQPQFLAAVAEAFKEVPPAEREKALLKAIREQEKAYADLVLANRRISEGSRNEGTDDEIAECARKDRKLKDLLHRTEATALCLSGGGIRSASFCLGVLEGLARFSRSKKVFKDGTGRGTGEGLMDRLDYLSTVSGGGYIGSWMTSWTYRRMMAARPFPEVTLAFDKIAECIDRAQGLCLEGQERLHPGSGTTTGPGMCEEETLGRRLDALRAAIAQALTNAKDAVKAVEEESGRERKFEALQPYAAQAVEHLESASKVFGKGKAQPEYWKREDLRGDLTRIHGCLRLGRGAIKVVCEPSWARPYGEVISALAGESCVTAGDPEPQPVRHLRSYSSFLAPELGATLDTATLGAIILRNLVVNWVMLIPVLFAVISLTRFSAYLMEAVHRHVKTGYGLGAAICFVFLFAAFAAACALPSHRAAAFDDPEAKHWKWMDVFHEYPIYLFVVPVFVGCWVLTISWRRSGYMHWSQDLFEPFHNFLPRHLRTGLSTMPIAFLSYLVVAGSFFIAYTRRTEGYLLGRWRKKLPVVLLMGLTALACSGIASGLLSVLDRRVFPVLALYQGTFLNVDGPDDRLFIIFALPLVTLVLVVSSSLFCALLGVYEMEEDREWWMRCGGCMLMMDVVWIAAHGLTLYGQGFWPKVVGLLGLGLGAIGSMVGYSSATPAGTGSVKVSQLGGVAKFLAKYDLLLPAISGVAVFLITTAMVAVEEWARELLPGSVGQGRNGMLSAVIMFASASSLALVFNLGININLFSLQGMYRMRLMRAFLGASNMLRRPDAYTDFDPKDTPHETDLARGPGAPLHVINTTLNLVGTKVSAWRQRRAESFTFSSIHAGCWRLGYVPSNVYGGGRGVTLATAMSISGAAFNPNMGYQSSPLLALLMTFFNLRLGYWLPNPKRPESRHKWASQDAAFLSKSGPSFALFPLMEEALGLTDDTSRWIELTDGGHFENLGLYEMVLRRCKRIIVVDAGADPKCQFEDLGNAIRKIQIDLGIPIEFEHEDLRMKLGTEATNSYCAVAKISYHCVDTMPKGVDEKDFDGYLVYIKAGLTGFEPADVLQYAKTHPTFPHESTADQFFNESQFESYRHLGSFVLKNLEDEATAKAGDAPIEVFLNAARAVWEHSSLTRG